MHIIIEIDLSGWTVKKSKIILTKGMVWPFGSDKWKAI